MDFLITLIGNAAVDPIFRKRFLDNPIDTADEYGFRFIKSDFEMMKTVFVDLTEDDKKGMEKAFGHLQEALYKNIQKMQRIPCQPPCRWSLYPPPEPHELRKERQKQAA